MQSAVITLAFANKQQSPALGQALSFFLHFVIAVANCKHSRAKSQTFAQRSVEHYAHREGGLQPPPAQRLW